ncbi:type IV conjugative transfer system protein TraL (plasmid) [Aliivibrio salmonicida]|uniref:type IV conjugative transfer system protein TraL n=1 Tax=Aliivibrio salmonicida TaxID=40269 RepID=UPI000F6FDEA8|nr:type IV conjugative transfer system protein TraL [Aliivibrio salmonicida]AZL83387.1 type IV conjugative transfer system protein TraL [Aliivibrio salmonicida]
MSSNISANHSLVPTRVNEAKMIGPFSVTEVSPVIVLTAIGVMMGVTNYGLIAGVVIAFIQIKLASAFPPGFLFHFLWYKGLWPMKDSRYVPDAMKRRFYQ